MAHGAIPLVEEIELVSRDVPGRGTPAGDEFVGEQDCGEGDLRDALEGRGDLFVEEVARAGAAGGGFASGCGDVGCEALGFRGAGWGVPEVVAVGSCWGHGFVVNGCLVDVVADFREEELGG